MNRYITLNKNNVVTNIRYGESIIEGEIQSDIGELDQIRQIDGSFITPPPVEVTPQPTLEDKVNYLYYKSMGVI